MRVFIAGRSRFSDCEDIPRPGRFSIWYVLAAEAIIIRGKNKSLTFGRIVSPIIQRLLGLAQIRMNEATRIEKVGPARYAFHQKSERNQNDQRCRRSPRCL